MLHLTVTAMPTHVKANPVEVSLLGFEAIVFLTISGYLPRHSVRQKR